jgi:hypothetical protein
MSHGLTGGQHVVGHLLSKHGSASAGWGCVLGISFPLNPPAFPALSRCVRYEGARRCPFCRLVLFVISTLLKQTGRNTKAVGFSGASHRSSAAGALWFGFCCGTSYHHTNQVRQCASQSHAKPSRLCEKNSLGSRSVNSRELKRSAHPCSHVPTARR